MAGRGWGRGAAGVLGWGMVAGVLATGAAAQQGMVQGTVRDEAGRPLAHADVTVLPGGRVAGTDAAGRFAVRLAAGEYRLQVSLIGYAPVQPVVRVGAGVVDVEIRLERTPLTLAGVQVTGSTEAREGAAIARSTMQLGGRALERELSGTVAQTLRYQPGIAVRFNGPSAALPVVRGLTGDRVLVLQDGQRTADLSGSADDHGLTVDPLSAQRVEVVRGPATLLYGNNALGGVINVISGDIGGGEPLRAQAAFAAQTETAYPGLAVNGRALAPVGGGWSVLTRAGARRAGDMRTGGGGTLANTTASSANAAASLTHTSAAHVASAAVRAYAFTYGLPVPPDAEPVDLRGSRVEVVARGELELPLAVLPSLRTDVTVQEYAHDEIGDDGVVQQRFELHTRSLSVRLRQSAGGASGGGAWGLSVLTKRYDATGPAALTPAAISRTVGIFGFQEFPAARVLSVQVGARADRYLVESRSSTKFGAGTARRFDALSGSIGMSLTPMPGVAVGVTGTRAFRAPTVEELFSGAPHAGTGAVEFGNAALRAERGGSIEAVLHVRKGRVNAQVAGYRNTVRDYIQLEYQRDTLLGGAVLPVFNYAQTDAVLRGIEGAVEYALHAHLVAGLRGDMLHTWRTDGMPLSFMPPTRAGLTLRWDDGRRFTGMDVHREQAQRRVGSADELPTDAHTILRADAGLRFGMGGRMHSLSLRVDNVTDALHREATSRIRDFAPGAGRNAALSWRVWF